MKKERIFTLKKKESLFKTKNIITIIPLNYKRNQEVYELLYLSLDDD